MQSSSPDFFDTFERVLTKSIDVAEKSLISFEPKATLWLQSIEQWLDSKLDKPSSS